MAEMKEFTVRIKTEGQETLQDIIKQTDKLGEAEEKNINIRQKGFNLVSELYKSFERADKGVSISMKEMAVRSEKVAALVSQLNGLNEESYKLLMKNNEAKMASVQSEISALAKNAKSVEAVVELYQKKKELIEEQAAIARVQAEEAYNEQIKLAEQEGKDIVFLETAKREEIARLDKKLNDDLKKNATEFKKSHEEIFNKLVSGFSADMNVYKTSKAVLKDVDESMKALSGGLNLTAEDLKNVRELFLKNAITAEKAAEETKKAQAATGEAAKATSGQVAKAADTVAAAGKAATETAKASTEAAKTATDEAKKTEEAAKNTAEATKKIVDISATRENVKKVVQVLEHYRTALQTAGNEQIAELDKQLADVGDNVEKRDELEARRAEIVNFYAQQIVTVNKAITAANKHEQDLDLVQMKQHAEKMAEVANEIKGITGKVGDYVSTGLSAVSNIYKANIASIDEDITHLKNKNAEVLKDIENQGKEITAIDAQQKNAQDSALSEELKEKLKKLRENNQESLKMKEEIDAKERELQAKKAKEQKKQEKIEKLNRKAALLKSIGEATANVAQGVTKTLSAYPFPFNAALAAVVSAAGAVQIAIMTKQLAKFEDGGLLQGKRHAQGGMRIMGSNIEVEGGEYVVNRESTNKNLGLIRYINAERRELSPADIGSFFSSRAKDYEPPFRRAFEQGGQLPAINNTVNIDNSSLIEAIQAIRIEPKVAVTDIHKVQDSMVSVDGWAGV